MALTAKLTLAAGKPKVLEKKKEAPPVVVKKVEKMTPKTDDMDN